MEKSMFICFAAEDRYRIVEPIVFHLKNYGINMWYDRYSLIMGDNRIEKILLKVHPYVNMRLLLANSHPNHIAQWKNYP